jgi:hypothetical protein
MHLHLQIANAELSRHTVAMAWGSPRSPWTTQHLYPLPAETPPGPLYWGSGQGPILRRRCGRSSRVSGIRSGEMRWLCSVNHGRLIYEQATKGNDYPTSPFT